MLAVQEQKNQIRQRMYGAVESVENSQLGNASSVDHNKFVAFGIAAFQIVAFGIAAFRIAAFRIVAVKAFAEHPDGSDDMLRRASPGHHSSRQSKNRYAVLVTGGTS